MKDPDMMKSCRFCGCTEGQTIFPREMYFGTRKVYRYFHCDGCQALSCEDIVPVSEAYPEEYYSLQRQKTKKGLVYGTKSLFRNLKTRILLGNSAILRSAVIALFSEQHLFPWFRHAKLKKSSSILDVGSGTGSLLLYLRSCGFKNLQGVDPNIDSDIFYENGVSIWKKTLEDITGKFDFIIFHHVLEHTTDPTEALLKSETLLKDDGSILIFTPVSDCHAFRKYGACWASIDAPRHLAIPSSRSMYLIAGKAGLVVKKSGFLSGSFQFWNSELYTANISTAEAYARKLNETMLNKKQLKLLLREARSLDEVCAGDTAMFLLGKKSFTPNAEPESSVAGRTCD